MKIIHHLNFQYENAATSLLVSVTEFKELWNSPDKVVVTVINRTEANRLHPSTVSQALQIAEKAIATFLRETMVPVYLGDD